MFCCYDFFSLAHRFRKSLGRASRNFGKWLEVDVILECLLTWAHILTILEFGAKNVFTVLNVFTVFCDLVAKSGSALSLW